MSRVQFRVLQTLVGGPAIKGLADILESLSHFRSCILQNEAQRQSCNT